MLCNKYQNLSQHLKFFFILSLTRQIFLYGYLSLTWKTRPDPATSAIPFLGLLVVLATASRDSALSFTGSSEAYAKDYSQSRSQIENCEKGSLALDVFCSNQQGNNNLIYDTAEQPSNSNGDNSSPLIANIDNTIGPNTSNEVTLEHSNREESLPVPEGGSNVDRPAVLQHDA